MALDKPVSILVGSLEMEMENFRLEPWNWLRNIGRGPLSIVVPRKAGLPEFLNSGQKFVSIRFSSNEFCQKMVSD